MRCSNPVDQLVPKGPYGDYKTVTMKCGQTSIHGDPLECEECAIKRKRKNGPPPGYCKHGVFINTDHDIPCGACEFGEG